MQPGIWLTVITVVKNDALGFARTLDSLERQDLSGVEFIVIDGSEDIEAIPELVRTSGVKANYYWVEPAGIYAAMNKGISEARGHYCYFANAGDTLFVDDVLTRTRTLTHTGPTWLFGPVEIVSVTGTSVITPHWNYQAEKSTCFSRGHFPCHQGTFVRTDTLRELGGFASDFDIVSDYAMFLRLSQIADPVELGFVVASFVEGGVSTVRWRQSLSEFHRARIQILRPRGGVRLLEAWNTASGYFRMLVYRMVISKMRRSRA
jgi:putative colanic acid biosynthesis glycosyltransferase